MFKFVNSMKADFISATCKYTISAVVMAAAVASCSSAILGTESFTSFFAKKVYEQMVALIQGRSL